MAPSKKQRQIYEALLYLKKKNRIPTVREIGALVGLSSPATVHKHLRAMEEEGLVSLTGESRGIRLLADSAPLEGIPLMGRIAAGRPLEAIPDEPALGEAGPRLSIDPRLFAGSGELMALRVSGDSMIEAGILDGDCVIIRRQPVVEEGEIAAVEVDGEVTLKRVLGEGGGAFPSRPPRGGGEENQAVRLVAANARFAPIEITAADHKEVRVLGRYVGLVRFPPPGPPEGAVELNL